ncbi:MAG: ABC transporter ATP-binding protein [Chloroflexi bacterium]|nr:ABC transporter ATP-binding protein [Chloroflexota bacterium]
MATPVTDTTAHLAIVCPPGSYAARNAARFGSEVERIFGRILKILKVPSEVMLRPNRITVTASDGGDAGSDLARDAVTTRYGPDGLAPSLGEHLARAVLHRLTAAIPDEERGSEAQSGTSESQRFFIEGAARFIAHQAAHGPRHAPPELLAAEQHCVETASRNKWRLPVYQAVVRGEDCIDDPELFAAIQEAFSAYLVDRDGLHEFLRFVAGAHRDPNHSAEIIFGKSLELLQVEWIASLRGDKGRRLISLWEFLRLVWPYLKPYPWRQVECLALMFISSISTQVTPFQLRTLIDMLGSDAAKIDPWEYGLPQAAWLLMVMSIAALFNITAIVRLVYVVNVLGQNVLRDLRLAYIDRVNGMNTGYFSGMRTGDLMARFTSDMSRLADPLARTMTYTIYYVILLVITFVSLVVLSWQLTLALLSILPVYVLIAKIIGPPLQRVTRGRQERLAQINTHLEEMVIAHPVIQIFNLQRFMRARMNPEVHEFRRVEIRGDFLRSVFEQASDVADLLDIRVVLFVGSILVLAQNDQAVSGIIGAITVGTMIAFSNLMGRFVRPIHSIGNLYAGVAVAAAALRRIENVLQQQPEDLGTPIGGTDQPPAVAQGIRYENVHFAYGLAPTLTDVSVEIPAGTSAAFVGPTGAGKTTLVNMLPRFYDPAAGSVKIDGRDIQEIALPSLRSSLSLVSQETALFNGTVRDNIVMGRLGATDDEIVAAAKAACIHEFIMTLPAGYDTIIGERGSRFSGGQRQRLAIARALLRDAPILILDEATSALDAETEHEILEELAEATRGKTVISITHRLALAMRSDRIYVLDGGRVVESGTHDELLADGGLYRKLFEDQNSALLEKNGTSNGARSGDGKHRASGAGESGMLTPT